MNLSWTLNQIIFPGVIWEEKKKARFKAMKTLESQALEAKYQDFLNDQLCEGKLENSWIQIDGRMEVCKTPLFVLLVKNHIDF